MTTYATPDEVRAILAEAGATEIEAETWILATAFFGHGGTLKRWFDIGAHVLTQQNDETPSTEKH